MRGLIVVLVFLLVLGGVTYGLLDRQGMLGRDGVELLWNAPKPPQSAQRETVDATPLAALLRDELSQVAQAKLDLERTREQFQTEQDALDQQRDAMADELEAVRAYREALDQQKADNVQALSRMLASMDAAAAADILDKLPEPLAVDVLLITKQRESGAMLEELSPDKAAVLSERIARADLSAS